MTIRGFTDPGTALFVFLCLAALGNTEAFYPAQRPRCSRTRLQESEVLRLDKDTELVLRTALAKVDRLMKYCDTSNEQDPVLTRFFQQCTSNCKTGPSSISNAGMGLFATKNIKQGTIINLYPAHCLGLDFGDYSHLITLDEEDQDYFENENTNQDYLLNIMGSRPLLPSFVGSSSSLFLDVNPNRRAHVGWLSHYINDGATVQTNSEAGILQYYQQSAQARNCVLVPFGPSPLMATVATKKIKKGQEFFTSYGCIYWLEHLLADINDEEECTEITDAIQDEAKSSAKVLFQAMKSIEVTYEAAAAAVQVAFDRNDSYSKSQKV